MSSRARKTAAARGAAPQAELSALLLCDGANATKDGKGNLLGVFDQFPVKNIPIRVQFFVYVKTINTVADDIEVFVTRPGLAPELALSYRVDGPVEDLDPDQPVCIANMYPIGLPVETTGIYWFEVRFKGTALGRCCLTIRKAEQDGTEETEKAR